VAWPCALRTASAAVGTADRTVVVVVVVVAVVVVVVVVVAAADVGRPSWTWWWSAALSFRRLCTAHHFCTHIFIVQFFEVRILKQFYKC